MPQVLSAVFINAIIGKRLRDPSPTTWLVTWQAPASRIKISDVN